MIKVSIIIPTHSPEDYLYECLNSIAIQTFDQKNLEVILVLNGPKYPFFQNLRDYSNEVKKLNLVITYCDQAHVSSARNLGLKIVRGKYVVFMDDDDLISNTYISDLFSRATKNGVVFSNVLSFISKPKDAIKNNLSFTFDQNLERPKHNWMTLRSHMSLVWGKLFPYEMIKDFKFDPRFKNGQDSLFMAKISFKINEYYLSSEDAIYYWRDRSNSASRKTKKVSYEIKNALLLMGRYIEIYLSRPFKYNILFFLSRLLAVLKRLKHRIPRSRW